MKADCNLSIKGFERVEIKNVSGFRNIEKALQAELERQQRMIKEKETIERETRGFDEKTQSTYRLRKKETEEDYGYIFDPDLTPIELDKKTLDELRKTIPELPKEKNKRFQKQFGLKEYDANVLCSNKKLSELFETMASKIPAKTASDFLTREILGIIHYNKLEINGTELKAEPLVELLELVEKGKASEKNAKQAAIEYILNKTPPKIFLEKQGLLLDLKGNEIGSIVDKILSENPKAVEELKAGNPKSLNFLLGQIMRYTKGKAEPRDIQKRIEQKVKRT